MSIIIHALWVMTMALYIGTAIYLELFCHAEFKRKMSALFFAVGAAIFIGINRQVFLFEDDMLFWAEIAVALLLIIGWYFAYRLIRHDQLREAILLAKTMAEED